MAIQKITSGILADGAIVAADIANGSITTAKIADGNVTSAKIDTVANTKITGLVTASQIANVANTQVTGSIEATQVGTTVSQLFGMRNRIINGAMEIDQRNAGALVSGADGEIYGVDRFITGVFGSGTGRISTQQSSTVPTGFVKSLINTVTTADAAPSANYGYCVTQRIEGYNTSDLDWGTANAKTVTVSFWVRNSIAGTYCITLNNEAVTWAYTTTYTVSSANTWEYKTVTFTGPTSGTWLTTNGAGIVLVFGLGGGSNRQATLNSWYAPTGTNTPTDASGCVDWIATSSATFYITGVQLEVGTSATPFERRLYNQELANCQRYYQQYDASENSAAGGGLAGVCGSTSIAVVTGILPVEMRTTPSFNFNNLVINYGGATTAVTTTAGFYSGKKAIGMDITGTGTPLTVGRAAVIQFTGGQSAANRWFLSAEL